MAPLYISLLLFLDAERVSARLPNFPAMTSSAVAAAAASVSGRRCRKRQPSFLFSCFSLPTVCDSVNSPSKPPSNAFSCMVMQRRSRTVPLTEEIAAINDAEAPENPSKAEKRKISRMPLLCKPKENPKLSRRDPVQTRTWAARKNSASPTKPASKAPRRPDFPAAKFQVGPTKPGHLLGLKMVSIVVATILIGGKIFGIVVTTICFYLLSSLRQPRF